MDMDMMCRRTLTGHKDDVTYLSVIARGWSGKAHRQQQQSVSSARRVEVLVREL